ncbi:MAG TPA: cohesin domain-containing protein, partial [Candidatus Polarisedimenticolia bacterium]|nr:cohesin domain-containing protein [Candidatus Polarisedimenticolia bacterium]
GAAAQMMVLGPARLRAGETAEFSIAVEGATGVSHAPLRVAYDPEVLEFVEAREGPWMGSDGGGTHFLAAEADAPGWIDLSVSRLAAGSPAGGGTLCTLVFRARSRGETSLVIAGSRLMDASGRPLGFRRSDAHVAVD